MSVFRQWPLYLVGRIVPAAVAFAGIAVYTRLLDPASFGTYALLLSTSYLVSLVGYSWLRVATLRMMAGIGEREAPDHVATIALSFVLSSLVVSFALVLVARAIAPGLSWHVYAWTIAVAVCSNWFELNVALIQAKTDLIRYGVLQGARAVAILAVTLALIFAGQTVEALLGGFAIGNCTAFGAASMWRPAFRGRFRSDIFVRFFRFGWSSSAGSLTLIVETAQRFLLNVSGGSAAVGIFAAAGSISEKSIGLLVGTATLAGQPLAFRARDRGDQNQLVDQLRQNAQLIFFVALGATVCVIALSGPIAHVYFGAKFGENAQPIVAIVAGSIFFASLRSSYFEQGFEIVLSTRPIAILTAIRIVTMLVPSVFLIPRFGAVGAATSCLIGEAISFVLSGLWSRRLIAMPIPLRTCAGSGMAAVAMVAVIAVVPHRDSPLGLIGAAIAAGFTYVGLHLAFDARKSRSVGAFPARILESVTRS